MRPPPAGPLPAEGGVLLVDKPTGPTSHDVVQRVRRLLGERRVGHTGTLDPFASGLLVIVFGPATRISEYLTRLDKAYVADVLLGRSTTTHDPEGEAVAESDAWRELSRRDVEAALEEQRGTILQRPPAFSAKKVGGKAAHRLARRGEVPELEPREVTLHALELEAFEPPRLRLRVVCSSGTYVRGVARDLGEALGVGAHLTALRRTRVGPFRVEDAVPLPEGGGPEALLEARVDPVRALSHLPSVQVSDQAAERLAQGQVVAHGEAGGPPGAVVVLAGRRLVAIATREGEHLRPRKVFAAGGAG